ncbi:MAG: hypothetical protein ACR5LG_16005 [Sodalis sp. (in: enterobacteria)]|uniref:hypothetical protein n=1 Tax=Sodalis sp. (in: enterobacteria) TaxID=1898979 RepID=UPI003F3D0544
MKNATAIGAELKEMAPLQNVAVNFNLSERDSRIALNGATTAAPAVNVSVTLDRREIATAVETRLARDGRRH